MITDASENWSPDPIAAKIIDDLIILLNNRDYNAVDKGLEYIARTRLVYPNHPVTLSLVRLLPKVGP